MINPIHDLIHTNATIAFNAGIMYHRAKTLEALQELLTEARALPTIKQGAKVVATIEATERAIRSVEEGIA
jgi:hypothetical protein